MSIIVEYQAGTSLEVVCTMSVWAACGTRTQRG